MEPAASKTRTVRGYFDRIARRYDVMNSLLSFGLHHLWKKYAISLAGLQQGAAVLDVCGGTADLALRAASATGAAGCVCVYDFSLAMMREGRNKAAKALPVHWICGDAQAMALRAGVFDAVLIGFGLRNLQDMQQGLREIHRVLKCGGKIICLEFSRPRNPLFRLLYDLYSFYGIPLAGRLIGGSREAYTYLPLSIRSFPVPEALAVLMDKAGFAEVRYTTLANGVAAVHVAVKKN
jgi:demethylmenaquinone methyltransferase/2-methoxy-6-polyprenyl-1,4-benzoquinol methylase